jgi:hypothetical protein
MQAGQRKGDTMRYIVRHTILLDGRVHDVSPKESREALSLYLAAWRMRRRIYRRFGYRLDIQKSAEGYALWQPGEEIRLVRQP